MVVGGVWTKSDQIGNDAPSEFDAPLEFFRAELAGPCQELDPLLGTHLSEYVLARPADQSLLAQASTSSPAVVKRPEHLDSTCNDLREDV